VPPEQGVEALDYCDALAHPGRDLFPPASFPTLWARVEEQIGQTIFCVDEVKRELTRRDDEVAAWAASQRNLFVPLDQDVQLATREVLVRCRKLVAVGAKRDGADPFVIGLALARTGVVVTEEDPGSANRPKIPEACALVDVRCIGFAQYIGEQGWVF